MKKSDEDTIIKFPCQFPIKVMGIASDDFNIVIFDIIKKQAKPWLKHLKVFE